jgi:hypothetical protein
MDAAAARVNGPRRWDGDFLQSVSVNETLPAKGDDLQ